MNNNKTVLAEIGVGPLSMAYGRLFWDNPDVEILMFEPHPLYYSDLMKDCKGRPNVKIFNVAIGDREGEMNFYDNGTSSSLIDSISPSNQANSKVINVQVKKISIFDTGQIDFLRIDTEGYEWFAIKHLVSRPKQIVVEIYNDLATYINPYLHEIEQWMAQNGYSRKAMVEGDFIYERN